MKIIVKKDKEQKILNFYPNVYKDEIKELNLLLFGDLVLSNSCLSSLCCLSSLYLVIIFYYAEFGLTELKTGFKTELELELCLKAWRGRALGWRGRAPHCT